MVQFRKWQLYLVILFSVFAICFSAPNFLSKNILEKFPSFLPNEQVVLGLDLQGGSYLLIEVDTQSVVLENFENFADDFRRTLRRNKVSINNVDLQDNNISFNLKNKDKKQVLSDILAKYSQDVSFSDSDDRLNVFFNDQKIKNLKDNAISQSIEVVRRRVDEYGTKEPTIQRQGLDRILLELPGITDPERLKKLLGKTAKLTFQIVDGDLSPLDIKSGKKKAGTEIYESEDEFDSSGEPLLYAVKKRNTITGDLLINAFPTIEKGAAVVSFEFNNKGGRKFGNITSQNVGSRLAIILDKKIISAPNIREAITGGSGIITGNFTFQEATDLSVLLRAGALPAPLEIIEERTVGPSLGADSIKSGKFASILGFCLIIIFMYLVYGTFGIFANIALIFNLLILLAILTSIKATLTLPGIAGIVLTIGMAVDANVLIFERIKEEMKHGLSPIATIDTGYKEAFKTIVDANITTLIAAIMLFGLGTGPVKGFAVTLSIGILTSMFTAIMFTRILIIIWLKNKSPDRIIL